MLNGPGGMVIPEVTVVSYSRVTSFFSYSDQLKGLISSIVIVIWLKSMTNIESDDKKDSLFHNL